MGNITMAANLAERLPLLPPWADPSLPPREMLPTMYDLPSEEPGEPGMPDEFHIRQPPLLEETFQPPGLLPHQIFFAMDMNLYYDPHHPRWYKRPDWFVVLKGPHFHKNKKDLHLSYVVWQEEMAPTLILEMLSPGTEDEDMGWRLSKNSEQKPPSKWEVYERLLQVPLYVVYSHRTKHLEIFRWTAAGYKSIPVKGGRCWLREIGLGIGLWNGQYKKWQGTWLRWFDRQGHWIPNEEERAREQQKRTEQALRRVDQTLQWANQERELARQERERANQEQARADQERERAERLAQRLRALGLDPDTPI
ncbi:Uma2 domain-containing protein [Gammaproteobacteria bacterium]